jgi:hypothetical protein
VENISVQQRMQNATQSSNSTQILAWSTNLIR